MKEKKCKHSEVEYRHEPLTYTFTGINYCERLLICKDCGVYTERYPMIMCTEDHYCKCKSNPHEPYCGRYADMKDAERRIERAKAYIKRQNY